MLSTMRGYHIHIVVLSQNSGKSATEQIVPNSLFQPLPSHKPKPINRRNATFNPDMSKTPYTTVGKGRDPRRLPAEAVFVPSVRSKTGSTNLPEGVVHLLRESTAKLDNEPDLIITEPQTPGAADSDGVMLGVLAVPAWMTPSDFLAFVAPATEGIAHLRIIRDSAPNRSMVVIKFHNPADAAEFAEAIMESHLIPWRLIPEICHVVHVLSIKIDTEDTVSQSISRLSSNQVPIHELPTCPVCLERMDSAVTGLITVPCSHTFHCMCLSKWGDSRCCPVCRYSQTLLSSHPTSSSARSSLPIPFASPTTPTLSTCSDCSTTTNLWICLICGNIGCGRYGRAHAHAHYETTTHLYALELETQRVWDYASDGYVHRLIQNRADGKLVELPSAASSMGATPRDDGSLGPSQADALSAEKIEAIGIEYSYLLTSQLDSQRLYYEEQTTELKAQVTELKGLVERLGREFESERARARETENRRAQEEEARVALVEKEKLKAEARVEKLANLARSLEKDLREERAVSEGLMKNLGKARERTESLENENAGLAKEVEGLKDQVRDVMFFLEARTRIEHGEGVEAEAVGGSVEVPPTPQSSGTKKKSRKK
ncbi:BRCA1-associated protein [Infundibulicybe gibba]|nr:BRCA1-associated protein [Infundibulicybe gibba]